jgi:hypothetical protein
MCIGKGSHSCACHEAMCGNGGQLHTFLALALDGAVSGKLQTPASFSL